MSKQIKQMEMDVLRHTFQDVRDLVAPRSWAPREVRRVAEIPQLANGKTDRVLLRRWAADA